MTSPDQEAYTQQLEKRIADLEDLVYKWKSLGAQSLFGGYGFAKIGQRYLFQNDGLQVLLGEPTDAAAIGGLLFVQEFQYGTVNPDTAPPPSGSVYGISQVDSMTVHIQSNFDDTTPEDSPTVAIIVAESATDYAMVRVSPVLYLDFAHTSDPTVLADGMVWYRVDTDKFRGRANGVSVNFITDGDTNWTDLTDGGATALHTHAGGSGHTIRENGTDQTARTGLNFIDASAGAGLVTDDAGGDETEVHLDLYLLRADADWIDLTDGGATTLHTHSRTVNVSFVIDGGGSAITTGEKGHLEIPFAMTITGWTILADQSGSIVVDVWKDTYANFPPTVADTIAGTEKPTLSAAQKNQDLTLSSWATAVAAGDVLAFNVDSAATVTRVIVSIRGTIP